MISSPPVPPSSPPTATATTAVNNRSGPSIDYPVSGMAKPRQIREIACVSQDGSWWQVRVSPSISAHWLAWQLGAYVVARTTSKAPAVAAPPPPPVNTNPLPQNPIGTWVITTETLNVRAGPGNEYHSYGKLRAGTPLQATGKSRTWLSAVVSSAPGGTGWVSSSGVVLYTVPVTTPYQ